MKTCPVCSQTYNDNEQNFCLNDGAILTKSNDDAPPTLFMDPPRVTSENWQNTEPSSRQTAPPAATWQNQADLQNQPFAPPVMQNQSYTPMMMQKQDQTLPTVSLVLGILGFVLICCWGGFPLGIAAMITGYLGMNNVNNDPLKYGGRGMAIAGLILGVVSIISSVIYIIFAILGSIK